METAETDTEEKSLVPEKPLDEVLDDVKVFLDNEKDESVFMNDLQDKEKMIKEEIKTDSDKQSVNYSANLGDHMYSVPDYAKSIADPEVQNLESNTLHIAEAVDTNSLHVYRQLLQLHLLQKQLEMLKCQQREQQVIPQQYAPGHNKNFSLPFYHSPGPPLASSQLSSRLPQNSARPSVSMGQYGSQTCPPAWPIGLYPNFARFSNNSHLKNNDPVQKKQCLRMKMGQMHNQGMNSVYSQRPMHNQGMNHVTTQDSFLNYAYSPMNLELEKHMKTLQEVHSQNSVKQSPVKTHQMNSLLPNPNQLLSVSKQNDLVQNLERRVQMDKEQEKHVKEIQQQLELEHDRFLKGQNYAQQSYEQPRLQTRTGEKKDQNQNEMMSIVDELIDYEKKSSLNSSGLHKVPVVETVQTQVSDNKVSVDHANVFKEPLPFHSYSVQQTNALKPAGLGCTNQNRSVSAKSSSSKSKNDNIDYRGSDIAKNPEKSEIPGFSELVNSLTMCQTCQFLREYGVNKRSCSMCKDLKAAHSVLNTQWMPNKMTSPPKSPRKSPDSSRMNNATRTFTSKRKMDSGFYSENVGHRVESASSENGFDLQDKSLQSVYMHNPSVPTSVGKTQNSVNKQSDHMVKRDLLKYETKAHKQTSNEQQILRKASNVEGDKIYGHKPKFDLGSTGEHPNKNAMQGVLATSNVLTSGSSMLPGSFSPRMPDDSVMKMDTYHLKRNPDINRVNSEPELSKVVENTCLEGTVDQRAVSKEASNKGIKRSHSQSEVEQGIDDINEIVEETAEIDETEQSGKKKKLLRCVSVPGWFGKGLNIKKRRKY